MAIPLQVYLDELDMARLEEWARKRGWSKSQAVRVAIRALTRCHEADPLLRAGGMIDGLPRDLSEHFDRYLEDTYVAEKKEAYGGKRGQRRSFRGQ